MQSYSAVVLKYLPNDFWNTLDKLQDHLNDECICAVLNSSDAETANKLMLDCLIENHIEDVIGFCDILGEISTVINLMGVLQQGLYNYICVYISMCDYENGYFPNI